MTTPALPVLSRPMPCSAFASMYADTVYGALKGLESFSQLVDGVHSQPSLRVVPAVKIADAPRFAYVACWSLCWQLTVLASRCRVLRIMLPVRGALGRLLEFLIKGHFHVLPASLCRRLCGWYMRASRAPTLLHPPPTLRFRGLLIDTSRHFLPVATILTVIDSMSYNKLNVLHWHIVDNESFPFFSKSMPQLTVKVCACQGREEKVHSSEY